MYGRNKGKMGHDRFADILHEISCNNCKTPKNNAKYSLYSYIMQTFDQLIAIKSGIMMTSLAM